MKNRKSTMVMSELDYERLRKHLFPGDGLEASAIMLCSRIEGARLRLMVKDIICVPHDECDRLENWISWPGQYIEDALTMSDADDLSLILIHSHPGGYPLFSDHDDQSDQDIMPSLFLARNSSHKGKSYHGSAIFLPGGKIKARIYANNIESSEVDLISVIGVDIQYHLKDSNPFQSILAFSSDMTKQLSQLHVGIVGVSGTGSIVAEQLLRMGFGEITVIDHDVIEHKNLNRILNSTESDATHSVPKVELFKRAASLISPSTQVHVVSSEIGTHEAIKALTQVDVLFCCVDTLIGRDLCQRLSTCLLIPLFDVGVVIPVRKNASGHTVIQDIQGRIDYIQPGRSTLFTRGLYSANDLAAEDLRRQAPDAYDKQVKEGYMPGLDEEAPAVISVNMRAACMIVQEFIARVFPYRLDGNEKFARTEFALAIEEYDYYSENDFKGIKNGAYASGLRSPLLGLAFLGNASWL
jgi:proteasome lid subunit RPN8/RPN11